MMTDMEIPERNRLFGEFGADVAESNSDLSDGSATAPPLGLQLGKPLEGFAEA